MDENKCVDWAKSYLVSHGYTIKADAELVQLAPWSIVWRIETGSGFIYLKKSIPEFFIETKIIDIIDQVNPDCVPKVIAVNPALHCFLMLDAGVTLRERFKHQFDADLLAEVIKKYTSLQCALSERCDTLIKIGVPDWRLHNLPDLYENLITNHALLKEIGILDSEKDTLHTMRYRFTEICERLRSYKIPETLDHSDFHDNNILFDDKNHYATFIDLGEMVVSHPFFSLHTLFFMQQWWKYFEKNDQDYLKIKEACFHHFRQFESEENLQEIFDLTLLLHPLYYVFCIMRLITTCDKEGYQTHLKGPDGIVKSLQSQKNNIAGCLRQFIQIDNPPM